MFQTIVVGTNWSDTAEVAFVKALEIARADDARLHVVSAHDPAPTPIVGGSASPAAAPDFQTDIALERMLERLGAGDVDVRQHTVASEPAEAILAVAEEVDADLIVVGNR